MRLSPFWPPCSCRPWGKARDAAKRSQCLSNLKQLGFIFVSYADDSDGAVPEGNWPDALVTRKYLQTNTGNLLFPLNCPARTDVTPDATRPRNTCNLAFNANLAPYVAPYRVGNIFKIGDLGGTIMIFDAQLVYDYTAGSTVKRASEYTGGNAVVNFNISGDPPRHPNHRAGFLFTDGHAEALGYPDVTAAKWTPAVD